MEQILVLEQPPTQANSAGTSYMFARNDGRLVLGSASASGSRLELSANQISSLSGVAIANLTITAAAISLPNSILGIGTTVSGGTTASLVIGTGNATNTSGTIYVAGSDRGFAPTSGNATFTSLLFNPTINQTGGANGITRGLYVNPTLTAAADWRSIEWSNNTGWGLYGAGTSNNYLGGRLGIGSTTLSANLLRISLPQTGATNHNGIWMSGQINSDVTSSATNFQSSLITQAATFTLGAFSHFRATDSTKGAGSTVTINYGFNVDDLTFGNNNYGFYGNVSSGSNKWNLYMNGTANNYMAGSLGIGSTSLTGYISK